MGEEEPKVALNCRSIHIGLWLEINVCAGRYPPLMAWMPCEAKMASMVDLPRRYVWGAR